MKRLVMTVSAITAALVSSAGAEVTYVSANRHVTARAGSAFEPTVIETVGSTAFGPFVESVSVGTSEGVLGTASQNTDLRGDSFGGLGTATADEGGPVGTGFGEGESWFEVEFTLDVPTPYTIDGHIDGFGVYSFTGPGLNIEDLSFGPKNANFAESGTLDAGAYTFIISAESEPVSPTFDGSFTLDVTLILPPCPADVTGPDGAGTPDGRVDALDFLLVLAQWGSPCAAACDADTTGPTPLVPDGNVDEFDLLLVLSQWGDPGVCP